METSVVTTKGRVVIPKKIRAALHIKKGTPVRFDTKNGEIIIRPLSSSF